MVDRVAVLIGFGMALFSTVGVALLARVVGPIIWPRGESDCPDCWHDLHIPNLGCRHPEYHKAVS